MNTLQCEWLDFHKARAKAHPMLAILFTCLNFLASPLGAQETEYEQNIVAQFSGWSGISLDSFKQAFQTRPPKDTSVPRYFCYFSVDQKFVDHMIKTAPEGAKKEPFTENYMLLRIVKDGTVILEVNWLDQIRINENTTYELDAKRIQYIYGFIWGAAYANSCL